MNFDTPLTLSPPWGTVSAWQDANLSIDFHMKRYYSRLKPAIKIARDTRINLESILSSLDDVCLLTCPRCPDACCLSASPWYDLRDLNCFLCPVVYATLGFCLLTIRVILAV